MPQRRHHRRKFPSLPEKSHTWWSIRTGQSANAANRDVSNHSFPVTGCSNASRRIPPRVRIFSPKRARCSGASWPYRQDCWICATFRYMVRRKSSILNSSTRWKRNQPHRDHGLSGGAANSPLQARRGSHPARTGHHRDPHTGTDDPRTRLPHRRSIAPATAHCCG